LPQKSEKQIAERFRFRSHHR